MKLTGVAVLVLAAACASCATARGKSEQAIAKLRLDMSKEEVASLLGPPAWSTHHGFGFFTWKYQFRDDGYMWDRYGERHSHRHEPSGQARTRPDDPSHLWLLLHFEDGGLARWETD